LRPALLLPKATQIAAEAGANIHPRNSDLCRRSIYRR
jgi:hypothetical protein